MKTLKSIKEFQEMEFSLERTAMNQVKGGDGEYLAAPDSYCEWTEPSCIGGREDRVTMRSDNRIDNTWGPKYQYGPVVYV